MLALVERAARDSTIDVEKMEKLLAMAERLHARKAESEYDAAMNGAQSEMRPVANDSNNPQTRSRYASYGALDRAVRPIYTQYGFSLSFGTKSPCPDRVTITCRISHRAGHTERVEIDMPSDGKGAKGGDLMSKTHATGSAVSYGMRYLLKMIFNIAAGEYDDDGNAAGARGSKTSPEAPEPPKERAPKAAPTPKSAKASAKPEPVDQEAGWDRFLAACKTKLMANVHPEFEWAWWAYAVEKGWILPSGSGESLADANPQKIFEGYDRANFKESIAQIAERHMKTALAFAESCDPGLRDELKRGMTSMLAGTKTQAPENKEPTTSTVFKGCPNCDGLALKDHEDLIGAVWCERCGFQWQKDDPKKEEYEEHEWMYALLPFAPKDPAKKSYKGMSLGQLCRIDNPYWFGIVKNFEATPFKGRPPSEESVKFGEACAAARAYLERQKEEDPGEDPTGRAMSPADDDVPFRSVPIERVQKSLFGLQNLSWLTFHKLA